MRGKSASVFGSEITFWEPKSKGY